MPNVDLSPLCSPQFKVGAPGDEAQALTYELQQLFNSAELLPRDALCIERGAEVWTLHVDLVVINADGSLLDAAVLAMVAALSDCEWEF